MGEGEPGLDRVRGERGSPLQRLQRRAQIAERRERLSQVPQGHDVLRPAPQRRAEEAHGVPKPTRLGERAAVVGEEHRRFGLEREGAFGVPQRRPGVAALPGDHAEQVVGVRFPRPRRRHPMVEALRGVEVARAVAGHALSQQRVQVLRGHAGTLGRRPFRGNISTPSSRMRSCDTATLRLMLWPEPLPPRGGARHWKPHAESTSAIILG